MSNREVIAWQIIDPELNHSGDLQTTITDKPRVAQMWRDVGIKLRELVAHEWYDIDTAPLDQTVLVFVPSAHERHRIQTGYCSINANKKRMWIVGNHFAFDIGNPILWQYLPVEPKLASPLGNVA